MKLLITGAWKCDVAQRKALASLGHEVVWMQDERGDLPCPAEDVEGVIANGLFLYHDIERFTHLRYIQLTSAGFDRVPMDYVKTHHIEIFNARGVYSIPMAEFAVGGVLQLYKQFACFGERQRTHTWEKHRGLLELFGQTVAIIGCGNVGTECAKRFSAFGCRIVGVDLFVREDEHYDAMLPLDSLYEVLAQSDVVVLTLPLTEQTHHMLNKAAFDATKEGATLVNIARGAVVDTSSMIAALDSGRLRGAVLDVFEEEPLAADSPLWDMRQVIVTPHNSFVGDGNAQRLGEVIFSNIRNQSV